MLCPGLHRHGHLPRSLIRCQTVPIIGDTATQSPDNGTFGPGVPPRTFLAADSTSTAVITTTGLAAASTPTAVEVVERERAGHPDTVADGIAEAIPRAYSRASRCGARSPWPGARRVVAAP
ncbi:methionine adenosyltransferase [Streptomyces sp. YIM S03343]